MGYKIETISVYEVFEQKGGCPFCRLEKRLEKECIEYYLGSAAMTPEIRIKANRSGFCAKHLDGLGLYRPAQGGKKERRRRLRSLSRPRRGTTGTALYAPLLRTAWKDISIPQCIFILIRRVFVSFTTAAAAFAPGIFLRF